MDQQKARASWSLLDRESFFKGVVSSYPVCFAFTLMYGALGMLAGAEGISLGEALATSATIFSVPLQAFVLTNPDLSILSAIINTFILNFRFMLMTVVLVPMWVRNKYTLASMQLMCGSTYMVSTSESKVADHWSYFLGVSIPSYLVALVATAMGFYLWDIASDWQAFMNALTHIVLPLHFTCLTLKRKTDKFVLVATAIGMILTPILMHVIGTQYMFIVWLGLAGILVFAEDWICGRQSLSQA